MKAPKHCTGLPDSAAPALPRAVYCGLIALLLALPWPATGQLETAGNTVENDLQASAAAGRTPNRLIDELSPYLLQHAYNPVQWYPWGEEAFDRAKKENKPIFLSIGYSSCHWCHVMARESFENRAIASILNQYFISIKLDREERPDIDAVYMAATELLNGYGGWPMTVFINHDLEPFYAGTYFPPETIDGRRGMKQLLLDIHKVWSQQRDQVENIADTIAAKISTGSGVAVPAVPLDKNINKRALEQIKLLFDDAYGGFGNAPKFPRYGIFAFLLSQARQPDPDGASARHMLSSSLSAMAQGGLFDHAGGGFHRYSVDAEWQLPHFEKMLYSQALLAMAYTRSCALDGKPLHKHVAQATLDFVLREMRSEQGGFYSALDADSERAGSPGEHAEGAYYLWSTDELGKLLSKEEYAFARHYYAVSEEGNIVSDPQAEFTGLNILRLSEEYSEAVLTPPQQAMLDTINLKLLAQRQQRPRPRLDDKIITAWNGMMIAALSEAAGIFNQRRYLDAAVKAARFVDQQLTNKQTGELLRRYRNGQAGIEAGLSDYVWYIHGLIRLYGVTNEKAWLELAIALSHKQNALFFDEANGGYFETTGKDPNVLLRPKNITDAALPAANAVAVANLAELYVITGDKQWQQYVTMTRDAFSAEVNSDPAAAAMLLSVPSP